MFLKASKTGVKGGTRACLQVAVEKPVLASGGRCPAGVADALAVTENMAGRLFSSSLCPAETRSHPTQFSNLDVSRVHTDEHHVHTDAG